MLEKKEMRPPSVSTRLHFHHIKTEIILGASYDPTIRHFITKKTIHEIPHQGDVGFRCLQAETNLFEKLAIHSLSLCANDSETLTPFKISVGRVGDML